MVVIAKFPKIQGEMLLKNIDIFVFGLKLPLDKIFLVRIPSQKFLLAL